MADKELGPSVTASPLRGFLLYFLKLGTIGFGGPIALTGYMQRDLVERRGWVSEEDYKEGLSLAQLAPGPLAAQLAIYLGWVRAGLLGATLVGLAFVGPSLIMVLVLSAMYVRFGGLPWMQGVFYGIGAAVIAIVAQSARKLTRLTLRRDLFLWLVFGVSALVTAWTESEIFTLFVAAGVATMLIRGLARSRGLAASILPIPGWLLGALMEPVSTGLLWTLFIYFGQASLLVFGSGLAIVPFLHAGVVQQFHWLNERQFLDAVAVSMITPGPVVITVAFIGYLVAGLAGSLVAALGMFLPTYLVVVLAAPYYRSFASNLQVRAFVDGVTAAATGAIAGAVFVLGRRALVDVPTVAIALTVFGILAATKKIPDPILIVLAGITGLLLWAPAHAITHTTSQAPILRLVADVPLPGSPSRFDYQSFDPTTGRLYISHMSAGELLAFDTRTRQVVARAGGLPQATGVLAVPSLHRVYVSAAGSHQVVILEDSTLRRVAVVEGVTFPDGLAFAPEVKKVFVSDEFGRREIVIDASTNRKRASIPLNGEAGNTQYDSVGQQVVVAVQTRDELVAIDPKSERITGHYPLSGADHPHGVLIDAPGRLAFVANEGTGKLLVVDLKTMHVTSEHSVGKDPDVLAFDQGLRRLYVAAESGVVTAFTELGGSLRILGTYSAPQAHSVAVNPATHEVYLPLANIGGHPVLRILAPVDSLR